LQFQRLRLSGFKSFVEPTEFRIEPGLTGIVGPNGCGKSNLLEALRWVMGATSAKAMRGEGMDDVIFGGSDGRPARHHAEVLLQIDNSNGGAPAQFNHHPILEVTRRIDRGAGSTYKVNGVETRARDVQLLFADASTGANSPSLVRQGQISELIAAKPSNRRRILEEAAGVSGLHSRRHEADLRLKAADANLARLQDVIGELEGGLGRLRREARQAEKYKRLAAEIRTLQAAVLYARWTEAEAALSAATASEAEAVRASDMTAREAALASTLALNAAEGLTPLREEAAVAGAVLQRLMIERDRLEREELQAQAELQRLKAERGRIRADQARETQRWEDAAQTLERLDAEIRTLDDLAASTPERAPELEAAAKDAAARRALADAQVERLAAAAAAAAARQEAAAAALQRLMDQRSAAAARVAAAAARVKRTREALEHQTRALAGLGARGTDPSPAEEDLRRCERALLEAKAAQEAAETERAAALTDETAARQAARGAEDAVHRLEAEAEGLKRLQAAGRRSEYPALLEEVKPDPGLEAALAAALGEDLEAALDPRASAFWAGADAEAPRWPKGAQPLADSVVAPHAARARLAFTALVEAADGPRLQALAPIGARLVSREGDLWRWDGFTVRAGAPKPAALRLSQRRRLEDLEDQLAQIRPRASDAAKGLQTAHDRLRRADEALSSARRALPPLEKALGAVLEKVAQEQQDEARREARRQALGEAIGRAQSEAEAAAGDLAAAEAEAEAAQILLEEAQSASSPPVEDAEGGLAEARRAAVAARDAEAGARARFDQEVRAREGRVRRREGLLRDRRDWSRRASEGERQLAALGAEAVKLEAAYAAAETAPDAMKARREALLTQCLAAEARKSAADDALVSAETRHAAAESALKLADARAAGAREARAASQARLIAAQDRSAAAADQVRQSLREEPEALGARLKGEAVAIPSEASGVESHIAHLERERDAIGPVNLRAEEEMSDLGGRLQQMASERADLLGAIARLRGAIGELNAEGRERLQAAFQSINESFKSLFETLFQGGQAELRLVESEDPLEAGLEIFACPPGKRLAAMSLMSGGEQALTATALIFAVFLANPAPVCVLDEVDAPLDDANVDRFCTLLDEMRRRTQTRFIVITHNPVTMARVDRLYGVTMPERGISQLVSVDLRQAEALAAE